jgi:hypothetical protein
VYAWYQLLSGKRKAVLHEDTYVPVRAAT